MQGDEACAGDSGLIPEVRNMPWRGNIPATPVYLPGKFMDREARWAAVHMDTKESRHDLVTKQQEDIHTYLIYNI